MFPKEQFNETKHFTEIISVIAQMQSWMAYVNDLLSFYKEFDDPRDQSSLINNYCRCEGKTINQALDKLTQESIALSEQITTVFEDKNPEVVATLQDTMQGWITWHLCSPRYRLKDFVEYAGDSKTNLQFAEHLQTATRVAELCPNEWAVPSLLQLAKIDDEGIDMTTAQCSSL